MNEVIEIACSDTSQNQVLRFNGTAWESRTPLPIARGRHSVIALSSTEALVCGGMVPVFIDATCVTYSSVTDAWTPAPSMNYVRAAARMVMFLGQVYVLGGYHVYPSTKHDSVEVRLANGTWRLLPYTMHAPEIAFQVMALE